MVAALRTFADAPLPDGLLDQWKRWERGRNRPDEFYRPLIAATFGTVVDSLFAVPRPAPQRTTDEVLVLRSGMDTAELVARLRRSSVDDATLDALALTVEQLCCDYATSVPGDLAATSREWLGTVTGLLDRRLTLAQHRDVLDAAGWLTLLIGCLEYDTGQGRAAEATRRAALTLGTEAGNASVVGWAHEMRAWFALTAGRYREVVAAAQAGQDVAPGRSVSVQLLAQEAKAWARTGSQRNAFRALEKGRALMDRVPYPERADNHFVIDPVKFDFYYEMTCHRLLGNDDQAEMHAREIMRKSTRSDGSLSAPMRHAEATLTLGVVAARRGDLDQAVALGHRALEVDRRSLPSLRMVGSELDVELRTRYVAEPRVTEFHEQFLTRTA